MIRLLPLLALPACAGVHAQTTPERYVIEGRFDRFTTDELGNVYALKGDELALYDKQGRSWLRNSLKVFGPISTIDAFYSLKPMVFSRNLGQLAVLDNTLSVQGSVMNLPRAGFPQVVLACASVQNHFWMFDERDMSLLRVDGQLRPVTNSGRLDQLLGFTPRPVNMLELDGWLYVNDPFEGILVFDIFGTYARTIPVTNAQSFEVRGNSLFHFTGKDLLIYDLRTFETRPFPLDMEQLAVRDARVELGRAYLLCDGRIVIQELPAGR